MRCRGRVVVGLAMWLAGLAAPVRAQPAPWWDRRWEWRRTVWAAAPQTDLPGEEVCEVELPTHGALARGAGSVRVVNAAGNETPCLVMQAGPADLLRVCFALQPTGRKYLVYYGNEEADAPASGWQPQRGVMLSGWGYRGGGMNSLEQVVRLFGQAGELQGRKFVPNIFLGYNPFGPTGDTAHLYVGWLICPETGEYVFATTSNDASFLLMDGKEVVAWPGRHPWRADAKYQGKIHLTKGLHKLTYYHVNTGQHGGAVAAWQPPGQGTITVIPPSSFAPVVHGEVGDLEHRSRWLQADFVFASAGEAFFAGRYSYRLRFAGKVGGRTGPMKFEWDFGDGGRSEQRQAEHVYLRPGVYPVRLAVTTADGQSQIVNRVRVERDWDRVAVAGVDPIALHADVVSGYAFETMAAEDLAAAVPLLIRAEVVPAAVSAGRAMIDKADALAAETVAALVDELAEMVISKMSDPRLAVELYERLEAACGDQAVKAQAAASAGYVLLRRLGEPERAQSAFERALKQHAAGGEAEGVRRGRIGMGDLCRQRGDLGGATAFYRDAGVAGQADQQALRLGSFRRAAEDYIRRGEFEAAREQLDRWEWEFPLERLGGLSSLLRARCWLAEGKAEQAAAEAQGLVQVNPGSLYAPELLMLVADVELGRGRAEQAHATLRRVLRDYPASPARERATKLLEQTGEPLAGDRGP